MMQDKQLSKIKIAVVLQKKQRGQALNAKEFAVLAGISYSTAREWFHIRGFPTFSGIVFWEDFISWRHRHTGIVMYESSMFDQAQPSSRSAIPALPDKARNLLSLA